MQKVKLSLLILCLSQLFGCSSMEYRSDAPLKQQLPVLEETKVTAKSGWTYQVGNGVGKTDAKLALAQAAEVMVVSDANGQVMAIERNSGKVQWQVKLKEPISAGPTVAEGKVFLGTRQAKVIALDLANGRVLWKVAVTSEVLALPTIYDNTVFIHPLDGSVVALKADDGRQLWRFSLNIPPLMLRRSAAAVVDGEQVLIGFANGKLVAINRLDGTVNWTQDVSIAKGRSDVQRMIDISAEPVVWGEIVYVIAYQGSLAAFSTNTGQQLWNKELSSYSGLAVTQDAIYLVSVNGEIFAVDRATGSILWCQDQLRGRKMSKPVLQKNYLVIGDEEGYLHWLVANTGKLVGRFKAVNQEIEIEPLVNNDKLYVYSKNGKLSEVQTSYADLD